MSSADTAAPSQVTRFGNILHGKKFEGYETERWIEEVDLVVGNMGWRYIGMDLEASLDKAIEVTMHFARNIDYEGRLLSSPYPALGGIMRRLGNERNIKTKAFRMTMDRDRMIQWLSISGFVQAPIVSDEDKVGA